MNENLPKLLSEQLQTVFSDPEHHLSPNARIDLYKAFGASVHPESLRDAWKQAEQVKDFKLTRADRMLGWLGILTAEKILPTWQRERLKAQGDKYEMLWGNPNETIEVSKAILFGNKPSNEALAYLKGMYYYPSPASDADMDAVRFYLCSRTATDGLEVLLLGVASLLHTGALFYTDGERSFAQHDFAAMAVNGYVEVDENDPNEKRLEFWQWWLTEAIPQAWELAQQ